MGQINCRFQKNRSRAIAMAKTVKNKPVDHRILQLNTWDQVYEKGVTMLETCKEVALIEPDPWPLEAFRDLIEKTAARGVRTTVRVYQPAQLDGVKTIVSPFASFSEKRSSAELMTLIVDGKQFLMALIDPEGGTVHQAVWSASPFLAAQCFSFMNTDLLYYSLRPLLMSAESLEELRKEFHRLEEQFPIGKDPGYQEFQKLYGW
ncbi:MAG: hypothetical protein KJ645_03420 [Planctomycetes bacterium]|nr:hypothetical protein [Planctomycetota bacterium]